MTSSSLLAMVATFSARRSLSAADVIDLRRQIFGDGAVSAAEAEALIDLDEALADGVPEWSEMFAEALTDYIVQQQAPQGYVSEANADWLMARVMRDGHVKTATELELLIRVLEKAVSTPPALALFVLSEVRHAVLTGCGPLARGGRLRPGEITEAEVGLLRRALYAVGGDGQVAITQAEADLLFDINDAVTQERNCPAWDDLFVKAVANFLMAVSGYQVPSRDEALRRERWLDAAPQGVGGFFRELFSGDFRSIYGGSSDQDGWRRRNEAFATMEVAAARISEHEAQWLLERIRRDGSIQPNERALLTFIKAEKVEVHPVLQPLLNMAV